MSNAKQIVQQCGKLIEDSVLKDRLLPLWRLIEWQAHQDDTIPAAALDSAGNATIHLAASVSDPKAVLVEFGKFILQRSGERLAIVLTRDRREAGVAALEDILKLMFGEVKL